ncbi:MAG: hypothetical protein R3B09_24770 [Nannocystaceae bacterium]
MSRFDLTFPAEITVVRGGEATTRLAPWSGGSLLVDLLVGARSFLDHVDALPLAPPHLLAVARATIDVDARRLRIPRDFVGLDRAPALRRAYARALASAWPGWDLVDREPAPPTEAWVSMTLLRQLPEGGGSRAWITHVAADGAIRDVDLDVPVEEALSLGPALREAIAERPTIALAREAAIVDGVVAAPCRGGALVDDRRRRIEVWWSAPTRGAWASIGPLARLWPGYAAIAHDHGLPAQIAGSGRDPATVAVDDAEADALLAHLLQVERWVDPVALQAWALAPLDRARAAGVPITIPAEARARPRPTDAPPVPSPPPDRPLAGDMPEALRLADAIRSVDVALADGDPPDRLPRIFIGPALWLALLDRAIEEQLDPSARARLLRWLAPRIKIDAPDDDDALLGRVRADLDRRARAAPPFTRLFGWDTGPTS